MKIYIDSKKTPEKYITLTEYPPSLNLSEFEKQVSDAIVTLWVYGNKEHIILPKMIYEVMCGCDISNSINFKILDNIADIVRKLGNLYIYIDANKREKKYLKLQEIREVPSNIIKGWEILEKPAIYKYSQLTGQAITIDTELLDIKDVDCYGNITKRRLTNSYNRFSIKGILLRIMATAKAKSPDIIYFKELMSKTEYSTSSGGLHRRVANYICKCLDYWKACGAIQGYEKQYGAGQSIIGFKIVL